jgi:hypothetical protein
MSTFNERLFYSLESSLWYFDANGHLRTTIPIPRVVVVTHQKNLWYLGVSTRVQTQNRFPDMRIYFHVNSRAPDGTFRHTQWNELWNVTNAVGCSKKVPLWGDARVEFPVSIDLQILAREPLVARHACKNIGIELAMQYFTSCEQ